MHGIGKLAGEALLALALFAAAPAAADELVELSPENLLEVETGKGRLLIELVPQAAPAHVARIRELAREGYYDGAQFYRVVPNYIAQTGEKSPATGRFSSDKPNLKAEFTFRAEGDFVGPLPVIRTPGGQAWARFCPGVLALAHYDDPDSGNSQFFIVTGDAPLERTFTVFGRVIDGLDAVKALNPGEPPAEPDRMVKARVLADDPAAVKVRRADTGGPAFKAKVEAAKSQGARALCALPLEVRVER